jgi:crotonobetainyl-CoA:carnitine CoA-transferase CaiB-like acyl-CoA transferase
MSGVARLTGFPGQQTYKLNDYYGDFFPGLLGAIGVLAALNFRERTGKGQFIDMAQAEALMRTMHNWTYMSVTGEDLEQTGNFDPTMAPSGIYRTGDGKFISVATATDEQFSVLAEAMGRPELASEGRFSEAEHRLKPAHAEEINAILGDWVATRTEDEVMGLAREKGFPAAPVMDDWELVNDKWRRKRGSLVDFDDEMYGHGTWAGAAVALEKTPGRLKTLTRPIGYHNRYVLKKFLGLSEEEVQKLERDRVIGYWVNRVGLRPPAYWEADQDRVFNYQGEEKV